MNLPDTILWGLASTVVLTIALSAGHHLRMTRLSVAFLVGTMFTPARDRALVIGYGAHLVVGTLFAFLYAALFDSMGKATWWIGAGFGAVHGLFVLVVVMTALPGLHPYMVSESNGPTPNRLLQPPGFMGLNYGHRTPYVALVAHVLYGAILGAMYRVG
jgi:uncharacterized membrane protein YagU involved in acid resistance